MRQVILLMCAALSLLTSCKKNETDSSNNGKEVPSEMVGNWAHGQGAWQRFLASDGTTIVGYDFSASELLQIQKNGSYKNHLLFSTGLAQLYVYYEGTVEVDEAAKTATLKPTKGVYKTYGISGGQLLSQRDARSDELEAQRHNYTYTFETRNGEPFMPWFTATGAELPYKKQNW